MAPRRPSARSNLFALSSSPPVTIFSNIRRSSRTCVTKRPRSSVASMNGDSTPLGNGWLGSFNDDWLTLRPLWPWTRRATKPWQRPKLGTSPRHSIPLQWRASAPLEPGAWRRWPGRASSFHWRHLPAAFYLGGPHCRERAINRLSLKGRRPGPPKAHRLRRPRHRTPNRPRPLSKLWRRLRLPLPKRRQPRHASLPKRRRQQPSNRSCPQRQPKAPNRRLRRNQPKLIARCRNATLP